MNTVFTHGYIDAPRHLAEGVDWTRRARRVSPLGFVRARETHSARPPVALRVPHGAADALTGRGAARGRYCARGTLNAHDTTGCVVVRVRDANALRNRGAARGRRGARGTMSTHNTTGCVVVVHVRDAIALRNRGATRGRRAVRWTISAPAVP